MAYPVNTTEGEVKMVGSRFLPDGGQVWDSVDGRVWETARPANRGLTPSILLLEPYEERGGEDDE